MLKSYPLCWPDGWKRTRSGWKNGKFTRYNKKGGIETQFRYLSKQAHPDMPTGSHEAMTELNRAREEALREIAG